MAVGNGEREEAALEEPKSRSKVVVAASCTMRQSSQWVKWFSISASTAGESRPSKYQQIK